MPTYNRDEIVIQGMTLNNKRFRPSDWAERLCGILSSFDHGHRLSYHQWVRPVLIQEIRCVSIDKQLQQISPAAFKFLLDFARDNDLRVIEGEDFLSKPQKYQMVENREPLPCSDTPQKNKIEPVSPNTFSSESESIFWRELDVTESNIAFTAFQQQYANLHDMAQFEQLLLLQQAQGYRLIGVFEKDTQNAVAVCGYRIYADFYSGHYLKIDDFAGYHCSLTDQHINLILSALQQIAVKEHCSAIMASTTIALDNPLHHFYLKHGFKLFSHQYSLSISST